jgi:acetyl-CoA carboxylase alpha subunit
VTDATETTQQPAEDPAALKAEIERLRQHNATLLGEKKTVQSRAAELEQMQAEAEQKRLEEKQEFEKLWRQEQDQRTKTSQELDTLRKSIADKDRSETALKLAASLTRDNARAELLKKEALAYIQHTPDGVKIQGPDGDMTAEQLSAHLAKQFPFLVDGNQASGGSAPGSKSGSGAANGNMGGSKAERQAAIAKRFNLPT